MKQFGLDIDAKNRCEAWEYACAQFTVDFGSVSHWLRKWAEQKQSKTNQALGDV